LKKSFEGWRPEIYCALSGIAHHQHEGTGRDNQNAVLVLTALRAIEKAFTGVVPPKFKLGKFSRFQKSDFFNSLSHKQSSPYSPFLEDFGPKGTSLMRKSELLIWGG
jgi:hypothetical protein